jgi:hypothetical protein
MNYIVSFILMTILCVSGAEARSTEIGEGEAPNLPPASAATSTVTPTANSSSDPEGNQIVVHGMRNPEGMVYSSFVAAQRAYEQNRHYAPDAPLLFQMKTHSGKLDGLRVTIAGENTLIPVPYDDKGLFTLLYDEAALQDKAVVMVDKKNGEIYWVPVIRSPGLAQDTLRLGDLRLYCRVKWALEKADASIGTKMMTLMMGGCNSSSFITLGLPQPGMRVRLVSNERQEVFPADADKGHYVAHRTRWNPPFGDTAWPDDTRIEFLPPEDGFVLDEECRRAREKYAEDAFHHSYTTFDPDSCIWRPN